MPYKIRNKFCCFNVLFVTLSVYYSFGKKLQLSNVLAGIFPDDELCRKRATLFVALCAMDPEHLLHDRLLSHQLHNSQNSNRHPLVSNALQLMKDLGKFTTTKGVGRNFSRRGQRKKYQKLAKNTEKWHYLASSSGGGATDKKAKKYQKRPKNSTFKPLSTIFVPCMKIHGGGGTAPMLPAADNANT